MSMHIDFHCEYSIVSIHALVIRSPSALQWIFPVILLIGLPFAPESPWWLVRKGQHEAAERVLAHLGGPTVDVKFQRQQIQETIELEDSYAATSTYIDCFRGMSFTFHTHRTTADPTMQARI